MKTATNPAHYVQQHMPMLTAYSRARRFRPGFIDADEFRQALVLNVLLRFGGFREDNNGSDCPHCGGTGCATWLGWRARRVASDYIRERKRTMAREESEAPVEDAALMPAAWGSHHSAHRKAEVAQVLRVSDVCQRNACMTVLADCDGAQVYSLLGIKTNGRNYRLRRLALALEQ